MRTSPKSRDDELRSVLTECEKLLTERRMMMHGWEQMIQRTRQRLAESQARLQALPCIQPLPANGGTDAALEPTVSPAPASTRPNRR